MLNNLYKVVQEPFSAMRVHTKRYFRKKYKFPTLPVQKWQKGISHPPTSAV